MIKWGPLGLYLPLKNEHRRFEWICIGIVRRGCNAIYAIVLFDSEQLDELWPSRTWLQWLIALLNRVASIQERSSRPDDLLLHNWTFSLKCLWTTPESLQLNLETINFFLQQVFTQETFFYNFKHVKFVFKYFFKQN